MSSIVPGPQKKIGEEIDAARSGAKPLDASALNPSAPRQEQLTGLDDWPESLRAAIEAEHARVAALDSNRGRTADKAVPELADCLAATVLCGEMSLGAAIVAEEWVKAHDLFGRNR